MKKKNTIKLSIALLAACCSLANATYYYINTGGSDTYNGTSPSTPWRTFANVNTNNFAPGDRIYLRRNCTWVGETLTLSAEDSGNSSSPVYILPYGTGAAPIIRKNSYTTADKCIYLNGTSYIHIDGIHFSQSMRGIYIMPSNNSHITIANCLFTDISYGNLTGYYGSPAAGICSLGGDLDYLTVNECDFDECWVGIFLGGTSYSDFSSGWCTAVDCGYGGFIMNNVDSGLILDWNVGYCGQGPNTTMGSAGGLVLNCASGLEITGCTFHNQQRQGNDPDGCGFDFEGCNYGVKFYGNTIYNCAAAGIYACNSGGANVLDIRNCTLFYNCQNRAAWNPNGLINISYEFFGGNGQTGTVRDTNIWRDPNKTLGYFHPTIFLNVIKYNIGQY